MGTEATSQQAATIPIHTLASRALGALFWLYALSVA